MKNILGVLALMLVGLSVQAQQMPNKLKVYQSTGTVLEYALDDVDSLTHSLGASANLYIHLQGQPIITVAQNLIDSVSYAYDAQLLCGLGGYSGVYGTMTDARDGEVYKTLLIGTQHWMAENLRYNASGSWLNPNNPCQGYGRLYDWNTIMAGASSSSSVPSGVQGVCPAGWHLPSDEEWKLLEQSLGMSQTDADNTAWRGTNEGTMMKSMKGWFNNGNGTNSSGFNAFPAGTYDFSIFSSLSYGVSFWSSTEFSSGNAWYRGLYYSQSKVYRTNYDKNSGFSCRCVEDVPCQSTYATDTIITCGSHTWIDGVTYTSSNNTATHTVVNAQGCDSIITLDLTITVGTPVIGGKITDCRDGEVYQVDTIGNQIWMIENLRYNAAGSYLNPNNPSPLYGRLYDWPTVMNGSTTSSTNPSGVQGICPAGWHVPSDDEWKELEMTLGLSQMNANRTLWRGVHGMDMKSTSDWSNNGNGNNSSGFNVSPVGYYLSGTYRSLGDNASFWTSTESSSGDAWYRYFEYSNVGVFRSVNLKVHGFSCRCLQD